MTTDPIMYWQAVAVLAALVLSIIYNIIRPSNKK